jgi:hypothetical protein
MNPVSVGALAGWITLHVGALTLAWATRVSLGSRLEPAMQASFFSMMAALGAAAWICRQIEIEIWPASAVTLIGMVLMAVIDLRRVGDAAPNQDAIGCR